MGSYTNDYRRRSPGRDDQYRPQYDNLGPPPPPPDASNAMYHFRGNAGDNYRPNKHSHNSRPNHNFNFRPKPKLSERPLLNIRNDQGEEQVLGTGSQIKFRDVDQLTDSDEAEMENSEEEGKEERPSKRTRVDTELEHMDDKPKWSNPDPYTALPAPSETTGKKLDFIKMIRKARNETAKAEPEANINDYISFSVNEDINHGSSLGPRTEHIASDENSQTLGKRKRGMDTEPVSRMKKMKGRSTAFYTNAMILDEWRAGDYVNATPWLKKSRESSSGVVLHKEIIDFYDWVKPKDHENAVRADVINRLSTALNRLETGELKAFGSFGAGLYLPVGDMDLVFLTRSFQSNGRRGVRNVNLPLPRKAFWRFYDFVRMQDIARPDSIQAIAGAKVPIIKFVERISGLKVDLSFNNDTGLAAIETFQNWKRQYPTMPMIVSIIKQYLMIRGLNDVAVGGLGGFSIICLVTSLIQHMPMSGNVQNLGDVLLEFFNFYGNHFERDEVAIRLDPPGYIDKQHYARTVFSNDKQSRLHIIDPHRPENNISGGTSEIALILKSFSDAHNLLQDRLEEFNEQAASSFSLLEEIVGGNFSAYDLQRNILHRLYYGPGGQPVPSVIPPPPPPISDHAPPPPPSSMRTNNDGKDMQNVDTIQPVRHPKPAPWEHPNLTKLNRRAVRVKTLRPDIAKKIRGTLHAQDAVKLGGYEDSNAMGIDLDKLEKDFRAKLNA